MGNISWLGNTAELFISRFCIFILTVCHAIFAEHDFNNDGEWTRSDYHEYVTNPEYANNPPYADFHNMKNVPLTDVDSDSKLQELSASDRYSIMYKVLFLMAHKWDGLKLRPPKRGKYIVATHLGFLQLFFFSPRN